MNYKLILRLLGNALKIEAILMLFPLLISYIYQSGDSLNFIWSITICGSLGTALALLKPEDKKYKSKEAFAAAALIWVVFSFFGALPFYFSGYFNSFIDCLFESVSGFSTTGASILTSVEILPKGLIFWRSFSHWIGGMGVAVFMMAIMPSMNASSLNLLRAESTGPNPGKIVPKVKETAKLTYLIYLSMTIILIALLILTGIPVFDAFANGFSIAGTGGFSVTNSGIASYNNVAAEIIMSIFMFLFGVSFTLYFYLYRKNFKPVLKDEELRFYAIFVIISIVIITINITDLYGSILSALRHSSFQVTSLVSSTGFSTVDYNYWPTFSKTIILLLMLIGCSAGSTGGGIKVVRILILFKAAKAEINKIIHPRSVKPVTLNDRSVDDDTIAKVSTFFFIYLVIFISSVVLVGIEGKDLVSTITAVIATLSNIGPGLGIDGPTGNFSSFSDLSKIILSICMLVGRLEFFPFLTLLSPATWKQKGI